MLYTSAIDPNLDPACSNGQGDINQIATDQCRSIPTNQPNSFYLIRSPEESSCIFPFQLDGREYNRCVLQGIEGFTQPLFKCPVRTILNRGASYRTDVPRRGRDPGNEVVNVGYCPTNCNGATGFWDGESNDGVEYTFDNNGKVQIGPGKYDLELDPNNNFCDEWQKLPAFAVCKNNCPGGNVLVLFFMVPLYKKYILVNFPVVSGGFALVAAATSLLPVGSLALAGGGVGLLGEFGLGMKLKILVPRH